jgi:hypothetical protein
MISAPDNGDLSIQLSRSSLTILAIAPTSHLNPNSIYLIPTTHLGASTKPKLTTSRSATYLRFET